jgi:hypothetical protein
VQSSVAERRASDRYSYRLDVVYQARSKRQEPVLGVGESMNVSSTGILFTTDRVLAPGMEVGFAINWPATFDGARKLKLVGRGVVVRQVGNRVAVDFEECQFRSRREEEVGL